MTTDEVVELSELFNNMAESIEEPKFLYIFLITEKGKVLECVIPS